MATRSYSIEYCNLMKNVKLRLLAFDRKERKYLILIILISFVVLSCSKKAAESNSESTGSTILKAKFARPLTDVRYESNPERIARGKYLTEGPLYCFLCHTERDEAKPGWPPIWEKKGSGALMWETDSAHLYAPNITPDKKTGIGNLTDDMIARALREGVGHDGRALMRMPWWTFRELTDEDVASIVVYLRTIPAIENMVPKRKLSRETEEELAEESYPLEGSLPEPDFNDPISRGKYLIRVSDCIGCHTAWYERNPGIFGGGNPMGQNKEHIFSSNISSDVSGIGAWPLETFISVIRTGKSGTLSRMMPWTSFKNMTDEDLEAIYLALMTTYPVKHIIANGVSPTYCEVCEQEHGLGDQNKKEPLKPYKDDYAIPADLAGVYVLPFDQDTIQIDFKDDKLMVDGSVELIPVSETYYFAEGLEVPVRFIRNRQGRVTDLEFNDLGRATYKKVE